VIVHMNYQQYRTARRLVHSCCNYDCGNCLLLDDGEECVCPQSITYSLICKWFRAAVLPLDGVLYAALFPQGGMKVCVECRGLFRPAPTGRNTAPPVPPKSTADRKPPANGGAGHQAWTIRILKALQFKGFPAVVNRGADTFPIQHHGRPSEGPQRCNKARR